MSCNCEEQEKKAKSLTLRLAVQRIEINTKLNDIGARQQFGVAEGKETTSNQRTRHYIDSRRAQEIGDLFSEENFLVVRERLGHDPLDLSPIECLRELWLEYSQHHPGVTTPLLLTEPSLATFN